MGQSADANICFGIMISHYDDEQLPWDEYGEEKWWMKETGFVPTKESPFDEDGRWRLDLSDEKREKMAQEIWEEQRKWKEAHPMPFELEWGGSDEERDWVVVLLGANIKGDWESPIEVPLEDLQKSPSLYPGFSKWKEFVDKYFPGKEAKWYLVVRWW